MICHEAVRAYLASGPEYKGFQQYQMTQATVIKAIKIIRTPFVTLSIHL